MNKKLVLRLGLRAFVFFLGSFFMVLFCTQLYERALLDLEISGLNEKISYTETLHLISENEAETIRLYSNDTNIMLYLKDDDTIYITTIPNNEVFLEYVQETIGSYSELEVVVAKKTSTLK